MVRSLLPNPSREEGEKRAKEHYLFCLQNLKVGGQLNDFFLKCFELLSCYIVFTNCTVGIESRETVQYNIPVKMHELLLHSSLSNPFLDSENRLWKFSCYKCHILNRIY